MVYISTDYVFDGDKGSPYVEDDHPNPKNIYGESKLLGERYLERLLDDYLIIRTQWLYGDHGKNFPDTILSLAEKTDRIEVVDDQTGCPTSTVDVSRAVCTLCEQDSRGVFHVSSSGACSWYTFALEIIRLADARRVDVVPVPSSEVKRPALRPAFSVLDCGKLEREAKVTMRPWEEELQNYFRRRGVHK
jgi:dTDP-4-dehydrorhamnose reductase